MIEGRRIKNVSVENPVGLYHAFESPVAWPPGKVYGFVCPTADGWALIDGGMNSDLAEQVLTTELNKLGYHLDDLCEIWCTHVHPDHLGLAARLGAKLAVPVWLPEAELPLLTGQWKAEKIATALTEVFVPLGVPTESVQTAAQFLARIYESADTGARFLPHPKNGRFEILDTPGHSPGHVSFRYENIIFGGDALEVAGYQGPEEIFLRPGMSFQVAQDYQATIENLAVFDSCQWHGGHQPPQALGLAIVNAKIQLDRLKQRTLDAANRNAGASAYAIFKDAFPNTPDLFSFARLPFLMSVLNRDAPVI